MKYSTVAILLTAALCPKLLAEETPFARELTQLRDQRAKAVAAAVEPINRRYQASLEQLLRRATQGNDLEAALKVKQEMGGAVAGSTPSLAPAFSGTPQEKTRHKWTMAARADFESAKKQAEAAKGRLAMLKTEDDQKSFMKFFGKVGPGSAAWLDARHDEATQQWVWGDGTPMAFSNWAKGQPVMTKDVGIEILAADGTWRISTFNRALETVYDESK